MLGRILSLRPGMSVVCCNRCVQAWLCDYHAYAISLRIYWLNGNDNGAAVALSLRRH